MTMDTTVDTCPDVRFPKDCPRCEAETVRADYWAETGTYPTRLCMRCGWTTYDSVVKVCLWCGRQIPGARRSTRYCHVGDCHRFASATRRRELRQQRYRDRRMAS